MKSKIEYLKDRYDETSKSFSEMELKSTRVLSFATAILILLSSIGGFYGKTIFQPTSELNWIQLILFVLAAFVMLCAWGHALASLKISDCPSLPSSVSFSNYIAGLNEEKYEKYIFNCYRDTIILLREAVETKSKNLDLAYSEITISAYLSAMLALTSIINEML